MRVLVLVPPASENDEPGVREVNLSLETVDLLSSILQVPLTAQMAQDLIHKLLRKTKTENPFLNDAEIALLDEVSAALDGAPGVDLEAVHESVRAWSDAHDQLVETAQKGLAFSSRAVRAMFQARTQADFEGKVAKFVELIPEDARVEALEFAAEVLGSLLQVVHNEGAEWDIANHDYIDNHVYHQLYKELVSPHLPVRGKALCERRVRILKELVETFQF